MGSSFGSVRDTLAHIYGAEWIWLERFQGRSPASLPDTAQFKDIASLKERWNEHEARLIGFVRGLTQSDLDRTMEYKTNQPRLMFVPALFQTRDVFELR